MALEPFNRGQLVPARLSRLAQAGSIAIPLLGQIAQHVSNNRETYGEIYRQGRQWFRDQPREAGRRVGYPQAPPAAARRPPHPPTKVNFRQTNQSTKHRELAFQKLFPSPAVNFRQRIRNFTRRRDWRTYYKNWQWPKSGSRRLRLTRRKRRV